MGSFRSSPFVRVTLVNLQYALRYPRSEPNCMTRPVSEHDQPHIRSPFMTAAPTSRLRRARLRKTRTILESGGVRPGLRFVFPPLSPPPVRPPQPTPFLFLFSPTAPPTRPPPHSPSR